VADKLESCLALAELARMAADAEPLENARRKHLQSAEVWEALARKELKAAALREQRAIRAADEEEARLAEMHPVSGQ